MEQLELRARDTTRVRCSLCHDAAQDLAACVVCGTRFHDECRRSVARCPTLGCAHVDPGLEQATQDEGFAWGRALGISLASAFFMLLAAAIGGLATSTVVPAVLAAAVHLAVTPGLVARRHPDDHWLDAAMNALVTTLLVGMFVGVVAIAAGDLPGAAIGFLGWLTAPAISAYLGDTSVRRPDDRGPRG